MAVQAENHSLSRQLALKEKKSVILKNLLEAKEQDLREHKAKAQQELEESNNEAAKVTVPCCVSFSLVVAKRAHAAECDANAAGRILLHPWRKTRRRRRRHRRNMTNS